MFIAPKIICPNMNCGYRGRAKRKGKGSIIVAIILFFFGILPGIIYIACKSGYNYFCPNCGMFIRSD
jgi:hypothetical protein